MGDGWCDSRQRPLINFLIYCVKGISFINSIDASDIETNAENLCNLFAEIVEIAAPQNVVHIINLIMKDISEMPHMAEIVVLASRVTVFLYNHKWPLNWLRKRPGWTEIIRPGATRFGTTFIALKSSCDHKHDLQALVTSSDYKKVLKLPKSKEIKLIILNERFWNNCQIKKGIKELFRNKNELYKPYTNIIKERWDRMLRKNLHAAVYWFNPTIKYDQGSFCTKQEVFAGVLDMIESKASDDTLNLTLQLNQFHERVGSFGRPLAIASCNSTRPDEWWKFFGGDASELQKFAIRILS